MPALMLDSGEVLIESGAILDYLDEIAGPDRALLPSSGLERLKSLRQMAIATAACDKAVAINYERRRPAEKIFDAWIDRCREQLDAALNALEQSCNLGWPHTGRLMQPEITTACMLAYVKRVEPAAVRPPYPNLERLSQACEVRPEFLACPQTAEGAS